MAGVVVVGVDGSASALAAVEATARQARLRGASLKVVHAFLWPAMHVPLGPSPLDPPEGGLRTMVSGCWRRPWSAPRPPRPGWR